MPSITSLLSTIQSSQFNSQENSETTNSNELINNQLSQSSTQSEAVVVSLSAEAVASLESTQSQSALTTPTSDEIFARLDANDDGLVSEEEFVAGRPESATEEQASAIFSAIDTEGDGLVTQEEIEEFVETTANAEANGDEVAGNRPPPPPPPPQSTEEEEYDDLDINEDGIVSINELVASFEDESDELAARPSNPLENPALEQSFLEAIRAYSPDNGEDATTDSIIT